MAYKITTQNYFDSNASRDILSYFFSGREEWSAVIDACDARNEDLFCYVAITGNHKLVKIGITSKPSKRLWYSCVYFDLSSLDYVAVFPGSRWLEQILLFSFPEEKLRYVKNKRSVEWFANKGEINTFLHTFKRFRHRAVCKEFCSF